MAQGLEGPLGGMEGLLGSLECQLGVLASQPTDPEGQPVNIKVEPWENGKAGRGTKDQLGTPPTSKGIWNISYLGWTYIFVLYSLAVYKTAK